MSPVTVTPPSQVSPRITEADRILRQVMAQTWPSSREAMAAIRDRKDTLIAALDEHARLLSDELDWTVYDPDLVFFGGDQQEAAIGIAEGKASDAARALIRVLAEYRRREEQDEEAAALVRGREGEGR